MKLDIFFKMIQESNIIYPIPDVHHEIIVQAWLQDSVEQS